MATQIKRFKNKEQYLAERAKGLGTKAHAMIQLMGGMINKLIIPLLDENGDLLPEDQQPPASTLSFDTPNKVVIYCRWTMQHELIKSVSNFLLLCSDSSLTCLAA